MKLGCLTYQPAQLQQLLAPNPYATDRGQRSLYDPDTWRLGQQYAAYTLNLLREGKDPDQDDLAKTVGGLLCKGGGQLPPFGGTKVPDATFYADLCEEFNKKYECKPYDDDDGGKEKQDKKDGDGVRKYGDQGWPAGLDT